MMKIQPTSEKAAEYAWFGRHCLGLQSTGQQALQDGLYIIICKYTPDEAILIAVGGGNFLAHPRSGNLRKIPYTSSEQDQQFLTSVFHGGYSERGNEQMTNELDQKWSYPLIDNDQATFVINSEDLTAEWTTEENYGNVWWIGADGTTLSWRGPANRHFALPRDTHIPGFTQMEGTVSGGASLTVAYTPFRNKIYQDGSVLVEAPVLTGEDAPLALVVGACFYKGVLICMTVSDFEGAFWFQVWKRLGEAWSEIGVKEQASRAKEPCYISKTGNLFVFGKSLYTISDDLTNCTKGNTMSAAAPGTRNVSGTGGYGSTYTYSDSEQSLWAGINKLDDLEYSVVSSDAIFSGSSTGSSAGSGTTIKVPVYRGNPATTLLLNQTSIGTFLATANGSYCSIKWTGIDESTGTAAVKDNPCSGGWTVTATMQPQGIMAQITQENPATTPLTITGPDEWADNIEDYNVTGGAGNVTMTMPSGCGSSSITVTDECGGSANKTVRMPEGVWKLISEEWATCSSALDNCETYPCQYFAIPAQAKCGYSWTTGAPNPFQTEEDGIASGSSRTNTVWRWGAGSDTESSLGATKVENQQWVVVQQRNYEWWCSATVKGW
jgi:hypothetical protein